MPIRVQLWKGDKQIGADHIADDYDVTTNASPTADRIQDQFITEVYRGDHGQGKFHLECDFVDNLARVYLGTYYRCDFAYPPETVRV